MVARPLVLCGPSGVGKSTIVAKITKEYPNAFGFSVSHTTRQPREGEVDGVSYHFVDTESMQKAIDSDEFIETAVFSGNMYGTSKAAVKTVMDEGKICILDIVSTISIFGQNPMFQKTCENTRCTEKSRVLVKLQLLKKSVKLQNVKKSHLWNQNPAFQKIREKNTKCQSPYFIFFHSILRICKASFRLKRQT